MGLAGNAKYTPSVENNCSMSLNIFINILVLCQHSLIVAAPDHEVESVVADLLPLLSYSAPFAIYHQYLQPLATCMHSLQASKMAIGLQITEPWLREYQVLPSRTHPHMQMNAFGGYILSGIRIHRPDP
uniref:tRNA (adenine(58)-N(1))-methyltransferase non-catalytic subunit TRM6 n=1 Tax=Aegilops tauschii subsp. strangulata TaxID=200361 RepID=A0A453DR43_AEGTS